MTHVMNTIGAPTLGEIANQATFNKDHVEWLTPEGVRNIDHWDYIPVAQFLKTLARMGLDVSCWTSLKSTPAVLFAQLDNPLSGADVVIQKVLDFYEVMAANE